MSEEWGPWIEHDGNGYPPEVIWRVCQVTQVCWSRGFFTEAEFVCLGHWPDGGSWNWGNYPETTKVVRYRIRKPKGLKILEGILADLPASSPKETAGAGQ